jgi:AAA domain, putative AbiEii toxin, Type IV TA system
VKLTRLVLENFRGAPSGAWSFLGPDGAPLDTVLVTGPASSGKTAFLEAIAALKESVGAYDMPPLCKHLLRRGASAGKVEGTWQLSAEEMARADLKQRTVTTTLDLGEDGPTELADPGLRELFQAYSHDSGVGKFEYFPSNRSLGARGLRFARATEAEARLRLGKDPEKYASSRQALIDLAVADGVKTVEEAKARGILLRNDQRDSLAPYRQDLAKLCPGIRLIGVEMAGKVNDLFFERAEGGRLTLEELSDSEKQAFLFCVAFRRLGLSRSILLIDQPELYLHTEAQRGFVRELGLLGVDNQIFMATGSLELIGTAHGNVVRLERGARG